MQNTTALITGASGGIGYEFAKILAKECTTLVLVSRNKDRLLQIKQELEVAGKATVVVVAKDLSFPGAPDEIYRELREQGIAVDILINNAGFGGHGAFSERTWEDDSAMIAVNITAVTHLAKLFVPGMVERKRGRIMNVASTAALLPGPFMAVYYASKAYVLSMSEALANELQGTGVTVTALLPGPTATNWALTASVDHARLFRMLKPASAADVASYGYAALMKGKTVAIHGMMNKIMASSLRTAPRKLLTKIVRWLHE